MSDNNRQVTEISDEKLNQVSGGTETNGKQETCPLCHKPTTFTVYSGNRVKCNNCRQFIEKVK